MLPGCPVTWLPFLQVTSQRKNQPASLRKQHVHVTAASEVQVKLKFEFECEIEFEFACEFDFEFELEMKRCKDHKSQTPRTYVENILKYHCCKTTV